MKKYKWNYDFIDEKRSLFPAENCNAIIFVNNNAFPILINGYTLGAGEALTLSGQADEIDTTNYSINWNAGVGTLQVWRKFYVK